MGTERSVAEAILIVIAGQSGNLFRISSAINKDP